MNNGDNMGRFGNWGGTPKTSFCPNRELLIQAFKRDMSIRENNRDNWLIPRKLREDYLRADRSEERTPILEKLRNGDRIVL